MPKIQTERYLSHQTLFGATEHSEDPKNVISNRAVEPSPTLPFLNKADPALAMLEFNSVAMGMLAADAMVKRAAVALIHAGTVQPGRYLVLLGGEVAEVEESLKVGREIGAEALDDTVWLPGIHPDVLKVIYSAQNTSQIDRPSKTDSLGIIETRTAPSAIKAADVAIKGATITLLSIRLSDGLGGKGLVLLTGLVADVDAAIELVKWNLEGTTMVQAVVIPQLHDDFAQNIFGSTRFFR
jgi:microcompartment protein CcmL/EutN